MNRYKSFFRYVLLHYFDFLKSTSEAHRLLGETYGVLAPKLLNSNETINAEHYCDQLEHLNANLVQQITENLLDATRSRGYTFRKLWRNQEIGC